MTVHKYDEIQEFRIADIVSINFKGLSAPADREKFGNILKNFMLLKNYPNPFNPSTTIPYELTRSGLVEIKVFDMQGKHIRTLFSGQQQPGQHRVLWNGRTDANIIAPVGTYLCRVSLNGESQTQQMILLK